MTEPKKPTAARKPRSKPPARAKPKAVPKPAALAEAAADAEADAQAARDNDEEPAQDYTVAVSPRQLAGGFAILAALVLLAFRARRRKKD